MAKKTDEVILQEAQERYEWASSADFDEREKARKDLRFLDGEDQWDQRIRKVREDDNRPCLVINKLPSMLDGIVGEQRMNRPSIKCIPVDSGSDPELADVLTGLIRNIEVTSDAENAYDTAFECAAACGRGLFRVRVDYAGPDIFEQDIIIEPVKNPFLFYWDPLAKKSDKSDARYMFLAEEIPREEFKRRFPQAEEVDYDTLTSGQKDAYRGWYTEDTVRVAEYFRKKIEKKTIYLLQNGTVTEEKPELEEPVQTREVEANTIEWYLLSGSEVLEGPIKHQGTMYPLVPVWGKELNIDGETRMRGLIRHAQDPQRMYNYFRSTTVETVALSPKAPFLLTPEQIAGHEVQWKNAHEKTYPYLLYNDEEGQGRPQREYPQAMSTALANEVAIADQEMRDTTSRQKANLGMESNEKSGRAIEARAREGDVGSFPFVDNLSRAMRHAGKVIIDLIPKVYDTERILRIQGEDGSSQFVPVNVDMNGPQSVLQKIPGGNGANYPQVPDPVNQILNNLTIGKYDVVVTVGPSYSTQRQEAADAMMGFLHAMPQAAPIIADLVASAMDWPGADKIASRLKKMVPPELLDKDEIDEDRPEQQKGPALDPKIALEMVKAELKERELKIKELEGMTKAMLNIAQAEGVEAGTQIQAYQAYVQSVLQSLGQQQQHAQQAAQMAQGTPGPAPGGSAGGMTNG